MAMTAGAGEGRWRMMRLAAHDVNRDAGTAGESPGDGIEAEWVPTPSERRWRQKSCRPGQGGDAIRAVRVVSWLGRRP